MVSKQDVNVTGGASVPLRMILLEVAGFPETQGRIEVITHLTLSPSCGLYVNTGELEPEFTPLTFH